MSGKYNTKFSPKYVCCYHQLGARARQMVNQGAQCLLSSVLQATKLKYNCQLRQINEKTLNKMIILGLQFNLG